MTGPATIHTSPVFVNEHPVNVPSVYIIDVVLIVITGFSDFDSFANIVQSPCTCKQYTCLCLCLDTPYYYLSGAHENTQHFYTSDFASSIFVSKS